MARSASSSGAFDSKYKLDNRTLYVIAPGGKISYVAAEFQEVDPQAYVALGEAVDSVRERHKL